MGKQTELNKNKYSKKNNSFTGHRVIGENKATHLYNSNSNSDSNTTDDLRNILESDQQNNNNMTNHMQSMNQMQNPMMNQMQNPMMNQMQNPMMNQMQNPMQNPMMNQMQDPMMNQMQMMNSMNPGMNTNNQFMGNIDPIMVDTLAPVNNMQNDFNSFEPNGLMNSAQMAKNMSGFANLSQLGNNNMKMANQYATNALSETNMNGMDNMMGMNNMGMNNMGMNNMGMNNMGANMADPSNNANLKNLANLYSMNILKR